MAQGSDEGSAGGAGNASLPSGARGAADAPVAPTASAAAGAAAAMTLGSILTVSGILLLFVIFALGLAALQYCFDGSRDRADAARGGRRRRGPRTTTAAAGGGTTMRRTGRGVDPELLRALPVTVYRAAAAPGSSMDDDAAAVECAVCLAELEDGEAARFLPRCGHGFHADCVDTWLASHTTCPLCRLTVAKPDDGGASPPPAPSSALPPVAPEPANYAAAADLPASVLLGVSAGRGAVTAVTATTDVVAPIPSRPTMVIEIPEFAVPTTTPTLTPRDAGKSPGSASARLRSIRRLWSFGRQGAGATSSCSCAGAGAGASEGVDLEQGIS